MGEAKSGVEGAGGMRPCRMLKREQDAKRCYAVRLAARSRKTEVQLASMSNHQRWVSAMVIFNSALYTLLLLSEWLARGDAAGFHIYLIGSVGAGACTIFGAKLIPATRPTG
jgi:hypothetical protein